jgi:hypothetical protein
MDTQKSGNQGWIHIRAVPDGDDWLDIVLCGARRADGFLNQCERVSASSNEDLARLSERDAFLISEEDREPKAVFKLGNLLAQRRLGDSQAFCGSCEVEFFS